MSAGFSVRMEAIASQVTPGNRVADVGCDHAYIPIELVRTGRIPSALAMDLREGPLERARAHIAACGLDDRIATRRSDGLAALLPDEVDTLLIAGMGGRTIARILTERPVPESIGELVLAPQSEWADVRRTVREIGFVITDEDMVVEDGKYYPILRAGRGTAPTLPEPEAAMADAFGPILLSRRHPVLYAWLARQWETTDDIVTHLDDVTSRLPAHDNLKRRRAELESERERIATALEVYYEDTDHSR